MRVYAYRRRRRKIRGNGRLTTFAAAADASGPSKIN